MGEAVKKERALEAERIYNRRGSIEKERALEAEL